MQKVAIKSIALISRLGTDINEILGNFKEEKADNKVQVNFEKVLDPRKIRRMNRISKMVIYSIQKCFEKERIAYLNGDTEKVGLIFNTAYGPLNTNISFGSTIIEGNPDLASPMDFANTVSNAFIGHAALYFNLKGLSTLLMGSNAAGYALKLLNKGASNNLIVSGVDEFCEPLFEHAEKKYGEGVKSEGIATLLLSNETESDYGYIVGDAEVGLGYSPLYSKVKEDAGVKFEKVMTKALTKANETAESIDVVLFASDKFTGLREFEEKAVSTIFPQGIEKVYVKDYMGETLGASTIMSIAVAGALIKAGRYSKLLVSGIEVSGTISSFIISK